MTAKIIHAEVREDISAARNIVIAKVTLDDGRNGIASVPTGRKGTEPVTASDRARARSAAIADATRKAVPAKAHSSDAHTS